MEETIYHYYKIHQRVACFLDTVGVSLGTRGVAMWQSLKTLQTGGGQIYFVSTVV